MPRLTDTQLVIMFAASRRRDRSALPLPPSLDLNKGTAASVLKGLIRKGMLEERPAPASAEVWREDDDGSRVMLAIADAGLIAIGVEPDEAAGDPSASKTTARAGSPARRSKKLSRGRPAPKAKPGSKQSLLIDLLQRKRGATIAEMGKATGWQPHSVRGFLSGTIRKRMGLVVTSDKSDGKSRRYRIGEVNQ